MPCPNCGQENAPEAAFCANCGARLVASVEAPTPQAAPGSVAPPAAAADLAGFWRRFAALLIDSIVVLGIYLGITSGLSVLSFMVGGLFPIQVLAGIVILVVAWLYYWLFIGLKGQTPGKMAVGVKVVDGRGNIPGLGRAALREVVGKIVSSLPLYLGFLWIVWDHKKQGWHDKLAGTHVVNTRR
jgi:uncharacterized RDD family membrane protein YckC